MYKSYSNDIIIVSCEKDSINNTIRLGASNRICPTFSIIFFKVSRLSTLSIDYILLEISLSIIDFQCRVFRWNITSTITRPFLRKQFISYFWKKSQYSFYTSKYLPYTYNRGDQINDSALYSSLMLTPIAFSSEMIPFKIVRWSENFVPTFIHGV